jgi:biotin carboxyl carrier protein
VAHRDSSNEVRRADSDVLSAIFDAVGETPAKQQRPESALFRARALEQMDVARQLDNMLPITSRRFWVALIGVGIAIIAALVYAAGVVQITSVSAAGRAVAATGIAQAASPVAGVLTQTEVAQGSTISAGNVVASGTRADGSSLQVVAPVGGIVWQLLATTGQVVQAGEIVATVLPQGSDTSVLLPLTESQAQSVRPGLKVELMGGFGSATGEVISVSSAPVPAGTAAIQVAQPLEPQTPIIMVGIRADSPLPAGASVRATIVIAEETLLNQLTGLQ